MLYLQNVKSYVLHFVTHEDCGAVDCTTRIPFKSQEGLLKSRLWLNHNNLLSPDFETRLQTISPRQSIYAHLQGC